MTWAMLIYKIFRADEMDALLRDRVTRGSAVDIADGYLHFSAAEQVNETRDKHFAGESGLFLLALEADSLGGELRWEPSRGGELFPHLYRDLALEDVFWHRPMADGEDTLEPPL